MGNFGLHSHEHVPVNNGFVTAFYIALRHLTVVGTTLLSKKADRIGLLQKSIADVLLVGKGLLNIALMPFLMTRPVFDVVRFQASQVANIRLNSSCFLVLVLEMPSSA